MILIGDENFPKHIINKLSQHHGTTVLKYFCERAKKIDNNINPDSFRYNSKKPTSIEAMLLMICDNIEAISRSYIQNGNDFDPSNVIEIAINNLMSDGQLDALTIGELQTIKKALGKELEGTYQKRVSYPDDKEKTEDK
jgi:membrane-associated HD superfamily phosphohydrolase